MRHRGRVLLILVGVVLLLVLAGRQVSRHKQRTLPAYAKPEKIEQLFQKQLMALRAVADGTKTPEEVVALFADPSVMGACTVNSYGDDGLALTWVKHITPDGDEALRAGVWFPAEPELGQPVVNIWGDRLAAFEKKFRTRDGLVRGCELYVDLEYLKDASSHSE
jgi:hypothetical protein